MFLDRLSGTQKEAFLELAHLAAKADGSIGQHEEAIMKLYYHELDISAYSYESMDLGQALSYFKDEGSRNAAFIELIALIFSDGEYHEGEQEFVRIIQERFGFSDDKVKAFKQWVREINGMYAKGYELVNA